MLLDSPRSTILVLRAGLNPAELQHKSMEMVNAECSLDGLPGPVGDLRYDWTESWRLELLEDLQQEYRNISEVLSQEEIFHWFEDFFQKGRQPRLGAVDSSSDTSDAYALPFTKESLLQVPLPLSLYCSPTASACDLCQQPAAEVRPGAGTTLRNLGPLVPYPCPRPPASASGVST